ncbi:MAG TPA: hypothetical protein VGE21_15180 [Flavobacteriales bacterium]
MKQRYHITPEGRAPLSDADIAKHRDVRKVIYNYQRAQHLLHRKPLYKDRRAFLALLLIVLLAVLLAEAGKKDEGPEPGKEQQAPAP